LSKYYKAGPHFAFGYGVFSLRLVFALVEIQNNAKIITR
jgi:hypothetical protein